MKILLVTPPLTQLNTPYPASPYLAGYLEKCGHEVVQLDLGIMLINRIFTRSFIAGLFSQLKDVEDFKYMDADKTDDFVRPGNWIRYLPASTQYENTIDAVMRFLRGEEPTLATRICTRKYLPEGRRFENLNDLDLDYGEMGIHDKALRLATLYIEDLADFIKEYVDPNFELIKYAEKLCLSLPELDPLIKELEHEEPNDIDKLMISIFAKEFLKIKPQMVGFCVPFPGNLYGAMKCSSYIKKVHPSVLTVMGGGYVNTELRQIKDTRFFDYFDFLTFDDGELPIERLAKGFQKAEFSIARLQFEALNPDQDEDSLIRTMFCFEDIIRTVKTDFFHNIPLAGQGVPNYAGMSLSLYMDMMDDSNPMMRLWSNGRWNKMILAHGCYWAKCAFCDTSLDYISHFESAAASVTVDRMEAIIKQTGQTGFHFVDEAAPPVVLKNMALEILKRKLQVTWWGNIRFEKAFTPDLCKLLAKSGCIAVSGGIEVSSERLLKLMNKGVTLSGAANTCKAFSDAGIMVHAYLMYGFPSETEQETIDSLEIVRQFFSLGLIRSAFWHRFALTVHSPVYADPEKFGVVLNHDHSNLFSNNEVPYVDKLNIDHDQFSDGLRIATYNYMHGVGLDKKSFTWFISRVPKTVIAPDCVQKFLETKRQNIYTKDNRVVFLGDNLYVFTLKDKKGKKQDFLTNYHDGKLNEFLSNEEEIDFIFAVQEYTSPTGIPFQLGVLEETYNDIYKSSSVRMVDSDVWKILVKFGLVIV